MKERGDYPIEKEGAFGARTHDHGGRVTIKVRKLGRQPRKLQTGGGRRGGGAH